jgi:hypothetical protein
VNVPGVVDERTPQELEPNLSLAELTDSLHTQCPHKFDGLVTNLHTDQQVSMASHNLLSQSEYIANHVTAMTPATSVYRIRYQTEEAGLYATSIFC